MYLFLVADERTEHGLSSAGITGIAVAGFIVFGLLLAIIRACAQRKFSRMQTRRLSISTQSLIGPEQIITDGSRVSSPLAARRTSRSTELFTHKSSLILNFMWPSDLDLWAICFEIRHNVVSCEAKIISKFEVSVTIQNWVLVHFLYTDLNYIDLTTSVSKIHNDLQVYLSSYNLNFFCDFLSWGDDDRWTNGRMDGRNTVHNVTVMERAA